ncbi:MAG: DUF1614 domain-containing protein [Limnochordales bacterium]|nr:DUF1614 domain-containing protein [Limnochordales bacterium]
MPLGLLLLSVVTILIAFGLTERALDRLHLTDRQALVLIAAMAAGSFIDLRFEFARVPWEINLGGGLIPLLLSAYVWARADTALERWRGLFTVLVTAGIIWTLSHFTDFDAGRSPWAYLDPLWLFGLVAGLVAYIAGRSRRSAFLGGSVGVLLALLADGLLARRAGMDVSVTLGGAGIFDASVIGGVVALGLAEWVGEVRERIRTGGQNE